MILGDSSWLGDHQIASRPKYPVALQWWPVAGACSMFENTLQGILERHLAWFCMLRHAISKYRWDTWHMIAVGSGVLNRGTVSWPIILWGMNGLEAQHPPSGSKSWPTFGTATNRVHVYIYIHILLSIHVFLCISMYFYVFLCICIYIYISSCGYVCEYIYIAG